MTDPSVTIYGARATKVVSRALTGPKGEKGDTGPTGPPTGNQVLNGSGTPASGLGVDGDFYIATGSDPRVLYGPKASGAWPAGVDMSGPPGPAGANGTDGTNGTNGTNGTDGADGATGPEGPAGPAGSVTAIAQVINTDTTTDYASLAVGSETFLDLSAGSLDASTWEINSSDRLRLKSGTTPTAVKIHARVYLDSTSSSSDSAWELRLYKNTTIVARGGAATNANAMSGTVIGAALSWIDTAPAALDYYRMSLYKLRGNVGAYNLNLKDAADAAAMIGEAI